MADTKNHDPLAAALELALERRDIPADVMRDAVGAVMDGRADDVKLAALLAALRVKGEAVGELVGAASAMRARMTRIPVPDAERGDLLDTCGTGGDRLHTFNISTAAALAVAACGVPVAKHGNRGVSSSSGSSDVLTELGVNVAASPERVAACVEEVGIGFCFAPLFHDAMKHAADVRRRLGFRTLFNLLGPLTNPAGAGHQLLGASRTAHAELLAAALAELGTAGSRVVCGNDELDEVALWGETAVFAVTPAGVERQTWTAADFGLPECRPDELRVDGPKASAAVIRGVARNEPGPARDVVVANAAAGLLAAGGFDDPREAAGRVSDVLAGGGMERVLWRLAEVTNAA